MLTDARMAFLYLMTSTGYLTKFELINFEIQLQSKPRSGIDCSWISNPIKANFVEDFALVTKTKIMGASVGIDATKPYRLQLDFKINEFKLC